MGPNVLKYILNVARKSMVKDQGSGIMKVPGRMDAEAKASEIVTRLTNAGLDLGKMDDFIRSEADVVKYLNILDSYKANQLKNTRVISADSPEGKKITEQLFGKRGEVVDMKGNVIPEGSGIMGGESIESLMQSGDVTKGTVTKKSKKASDRDMFRAANERFSRPKSEVDSIIRNIKKLDPIEAMKEANKILKREDYYKNMSAADAKRILTETEDHIFERNKTVFGPEDYSPDISKNKKEIIKLENKLGRLNPKAAGFKEKARELINKIEELKNPKGDEVTKAYIDAVRKGKFEGTEDQFRDMIDKMMDEDFARGGRVGLRGGGGYQGAPAGGVTSGGSSGRDRGMGMAGKTGDYSAPTSTGGGGNDQQYDYSIPKQIAKDITINTGKHLVGQKIASALGIGPTPFGIIMALKGLYNQTQNPVYSEEDLTYGTPYQTGGRVGLKDGPPDPSKRKFMKIAAGVASIPIVGKFFKPAKVAKVAKTVSKVPLVKTPPVNGKPEWFDALVNKVILEGDDVTKNLATKDREIIHTKKLNDKESVTVTQDLDDGAIRVEYDSPDNMGQEPVMMQFKPGMADETTGGKKPADKFDVVETEPQYVGGPEDADIEFIGESGGPGIDYIASDVTNLKTFATGKGPTMKEIVKSKKRKDLVGKVNNDSYEAAEYLGGKYGDGPDPIDYALGGRVGLSSGGLAYLLGE